MSHFLDTSVVVRYLIERPPDQAEMAARIVDGAEDLMITDVSIAETAYVLTSNYGVPCSEAVHAIISFMTRENVRLYGLDKGIVLQALEMCRPSGRVSVADALIWAAARSSGAEAIYPFDQRFPSDGIEIRQAAS